MLRLRLDELMARAGVTQARALPALAVTGITADSRAVRPGMIFAALPGIRADGREFIADAVTRGAAAILALPGTVLPAGSAVPLIEDAAPRRALARLAAASEGAQPKTVIAVTGTNGKTSTVDFLRQLWEAAAIRGASLGTLGIIAPADAGLSGGALTTPDPVALAQTLGALARAQVDHAALEASSHGLDQFRLDGVRLAAAAVTNLTRDHLDYHGGMDAYRDAKLRLFGELLPEGAPAFAMAGLEPAMQARLQQTAASRRLTLYRVGEGGEIWRLLHAEPTPDGQILRIDAGAGPRDVPIRLPGRFQADNVLLAAALAEATGVAAAADRLPGLRGVRGRMERVARLANGAAAYVDYAHTPDALDRLLRALRPHARRLVCVFGAGGDRDAGKRPLMGAVVARGADLAIVTDDNPRGEAPAAIRAAILAGCPGAREIGDRAQAIAAGLNALGAGDVLVVAGKGHEQGQSIDGEVLPFDDASVLRGLAA